MNLSLTNTWDRIMGKTQPVNNRLPGVKKQKVIMPPSGRSSLPETQNGIQMVSSLYNDAVLPLDYNPALIPVIRNLFRYNQNVSLALTDLVQLTNPGYRIKFDGSVDEKQTLIMGDYIKALGERWGMYRGGMSGVINTLAIQLYQVGAGAMEFIPYNDLSGIEAVYFLKPETIQFKPKGNTYVPYQRLMGNATMQAHDTTHLGFKKLNPLTFRYAPLISDSDVPTGIPLLLAALEDLGIQKSMMANISYIIETLGILGFMSVLMEKPNQTAGESNDAYKARLTSFLDETKVSINKGMKEGTLVAYDGDIKFDFQSVTKSVAGVSELFSLNQQMVANGIKLPGTFMGVSGGSSESLLSVVFTKMLSQLNNVQNIIKGILEYGISLDLRLAGFTFKTFSIVFDNSTITDELKIQQGREIKQRVDALLYRDGIIGMSQYAADFGFDKPDEPKPRVSLEQVKTEPGGAQKEKDKAGTNVTERRARDKAKPQPKRKDQDTKKR